eukprot:scaffold651583_cov50-Prasinocladus_malaysianus.AAC.1
MPRNKLTTILAEQKPPGLTKPHGVADVSMWVDEHHLITCLAATPDCRIVISGSRDHTLKVWDLES